MSSPSGQIDYRALLQRAYDSLGEMQEKLARAERAQREPIAVVGMALRFPGGATDPESFWKILMDGIDVVTEVPPGRWDVDEFYDPDPDTVGKTYSRWGAFLEQVDQFDPQFFGISPREAAAMDPQQRLLLEVSWEALENAGHASDELAGSRTGVFVGMVGSDYGVIPKDTLNVDAYFGTGISRSIAAGRISYAFGLQGPSLAVDTACSSSALATHLAVQSLRSGDCDMALAGGSNLILVPDGGVSASRARMMSFTGRCRAFDSGADGYVRAEGVVMVVLKRLSDAVRDRDHILGVVLGSVTNQDGRSNGITAPNGAAQELLLRAALADAKLDAADISLIEAHGTGTSLGDPIEMRALGNVLGEGHSPERPLLVSSVKTNIGHTEGVAGTAGLAKVLLALEHKRLPPHLHLREKNPHIAWDALPVHIPTEPTPWNVPAGMRRIAGVSSFGFSGTNSHIIVAEPPVPEPRQLPARPYRLLALSARNAPALRELRQRYGRTLAGTPDLELADITFTANTGRTHHPERLAVVAGSVAELREKLAAWSAGEKPDGVLRGANLTGAAPEVAFLFTGQGAQYVGMGRQLHEHEPVFRAALGRCDELLRQHLERPLLSVLYPAAGQEAEAELLIHQTGYTQPALFALGYALAELWKSWGIQPSLVMGHSIGEYVAATVAGVLSLEDALTLVAARGRLMQALPAGGAMAAVFTDEATIAEAISAVGDRVSIAAVNGPRNVVVSGEGTAVCSLLESLQAAGVKSKPLTVSHAFHSQLMEPMLDEFTRVAESVEYHAPRIGLVSNVSGRLAGPEIRTPAYWREHVLAPVRFADAVATLHAEGCTAFLEAGPQPTLLGMAQRCPTPGEPLWLPSIRQSCAELQQMRESLASLYVRGAAIGWRGVERDEGQRRVPLPTYPFQRQRYWADFGKLGARAAQARLHPLLGERLRSPLIAGAVFQSHLGIEDPAYLDHHRIFDVPLFPATGFVEMVWAAARQAFAGPVALEEIQFRDALALPEAGAVTVQIALGSAEAGRCSFQVFSLQDGEEESWKLHVSGHVRVSAAASPKAAPPALTEVQARCTEGFATEPFYERLVDLGVSYGPAFRGLRQVWRRDGEALARIQATGEIARDTAAYQLHPALLDACLQLLGAAIPGAGADSSVDDVYIPVELGSYRPLQPGGPAFWCQAVLDDAEAGSDLLIGSLRLCDEGGSPIAEIEGVRLRRVTRHAFEKARGGSSAHIDRWLYTLSWDEAAEEPARDEWAAGHWLVFADEGGTGEALARRIEAEGGSCGVLRAADFDPDDPDDFDSIIAAAVGGGHERLRGVVHLWSLDRPADLALGSITAHHQRVCGSTLALVKALVAGGEDAARVALVTRGAAAVPDDQAGISPEQTALWGLANTLTAEHPEMACACIDLDPAGGGEPAARLAAELAADTREDRVALRGRGRFVARLVRHAAQEQPAAVADGPVELDISERGILDNLQLRPLTRREPGPLEVEIEVRASGLNFRDVLNALGMYPGNAGALGSECAGVVTAVGAGVTAFAPGDEVLAMAGGTFRSHVIAPAHSVHHKPPMLSFAAAAAVPITFLTAYYGLHTLAGIKAGDRVLIHAAAGGVGLAAVQIAQLAGAEIYATAGSAGKHAYLRSIGIANVMSSRTLDFADEIMELTSGEGVDIVLNSLADDFIPASLSVLSDHGCFLEIGKRGVWTNEQVAELDSTLRYFLYDLSEAMGPDSDFFATTMTWLAAGFGSGALRPLPLRTFPLAQAADAFRFMAQAKHTGKIVITQDRRDAAAGAAIRPDSTYLVTGGLGGLGLAVSRWMVERGATNLVLMGRSEPSAEARAAIHQLEAAGAKLVVHLGDIGAKADVAAVVRRIAAEMPPLRGVVHAAGVLDDGMLLQQSWPRFETVMRPKVRGTWLLHEETRNLPLDFFVLFSTGSALLGSAGQGNYSAANAFLDGIAHYRRALGLAATTINWGAWSDVGMAAALGEPGRRRWRELGLDLISPAEGIHALERILGEDVVQVAVLPFDWARFVQRSERVVRPILARVAVGHAPPQHDVAAGSRGSLLRQLDESPPEARFEILRQHLEERVRHVLRLDSTLALDPGLGLSDLGMDSLMAVELSNHLQSSLGRSLPSTLAFEHPTLAALAQHLASEVLALGVSADSNDEIDAAHRSTAPADAVRVTAIATLSDGEVEAALLEELERAGY
jgi:acyl transferase domain-containing protein/acyl carrier protein